MPRPTRTPAFERRRLRLLPALAAALLLFRAAGPAAAEPPVPAPTGYVTDAAGVMGEWAARTETLCRDVEKRSGAEIAVLTVRTTGGVPAADFAQAVFDRWKIGKKGKDAGVLILVAVDDRTMRIQTGYGVEGILPDGKVGEIRDRIMLPEFKRGQFGQGIYLGAAFIGKALAGEAASVPPRKRARSVLPGLVFFGLMALLALRALFLGPFGASGRRGGYHGGGFWGGYGGGGFGGGFGGGGFGGFGGGSSGGGGAGGSW